MTIMADFLPPEFSLTQTNQKCLCIARVTLSSCQKTVLLLTNIFTPLEKYIYF